MQDADSVKCGLNSSLGGGLSRGGEDLQILSTSEVLVEPRFVHDGADAREGHVTVLRNLVSEQFHRSGVSVGKTQ
jgi:hypothetical protein